jgi:hypothetical protein
LHQRFEISLLKVIQSGAAIMRVDGASVTRTVPTSELGKPLTANLMVADTKISI